MLTFKNTRGGKEIEESITDEIFFYNFVARAQMLQEKYLSILETFLEIILTSILYVCITHHNLVDTLVFPVQFADFEHVEGLVFEHPELVISRDLLIILIPTGTRSALSIFESR